MTKPHPHKPAKPKTFGINALSIGAAAIGLGGALLAVFLRSKANPAEHAAPDLALDKPRPGSTDRASDAFRPDPTAVPTKAERESLRPATGPGPVVRRGSWFDARLKRSDRRGKEGAGHAPAGRVPSPTRRPARLALHP